METVKLKAKKRDLNIKAKDYRKDGFITAEYYGAGVENISLAIDYQDFRRAYRAAGKSTVLELEVEGEKMVYALVHEVDYDPVSDKYMHVDLIHVDLDKEITARIPFVFVGEAPAVRELQGTFVSALDGVEVKCLARDLISAIEVDISGLVDFSAVIRVSDLKIPENITVISGADEAVATVSPPKEEEEEVIAPAEGEEGAEGEAPAEGAAEGEAGEEGGEAKEGE